MYSTYTTLTEKTRFRASQVKQDVGTIWIRNDDGLVMALSFEETEQLVAELVRELSAGEAQARGAAA